MLFVKCPAFEGAYESLLFDLSDLEAWDDATEAMSEAGETSLPVYEGDPEGDFEPTGCHLRTISDAARRVVGSLELDDAISEIGGVTTGVDVHLRNADQGEVQIAKHLSPDPYEVLTLEMRTAGQGGNHVNLYLRTGIAEQLGRKILDAAMIAGGDRRTSSGPPAVKVVEATVVDPEPAPVSREDITELVGRFVYESMRRWCEHNLMPTRDEAEDQLNHVRGVILGGVTDGQAAGWVRFTKDAERGGQ